ncbi:MAG: patatin-like phospholipase family protein [Vicinamibacteria bacterium]
MSTPTRKRKRRASKIALVCAGGGVTGALYEIGCLKALEESLDLDLTRLDCYVGVSGGAFVASLLASGFGPTEIYREITTGGAAPFGVPAAALFRLGVAEYARRALRLPGAVLTAAKALFTGDTASPRDVLLPFLEAIPPGLLDNSGVEEFLSGLFARFSRPNDFDSLTVPLRIVAVELDRAETVAFGDRKHRDVSISQAVQASTALPGLYRPVRLKGHDYVDGGVTKTAHINLAIRAGADLVICINPLVPILNRKNGGSLGPLSSHGVDTVLGQVLRILLHGRFNYGMDRYRTEHPEVDILLIQPTRDDLTMFRYDIMRYSARKALARHGRATTLATLDSRQHKIEPTLARHGVRFKKRVDEDDREATRPEEHKARSAQTLAASLDALERSLTTAR